MSKSKMVVKALCVVACFFMLSAPTVFAQCDMSWQNDVCIGDTDYDCDVDGNDVAVFKSHFGRNELVNPCPPNGPAPVPKTGQITQWATGDDGDLGKGVAWPNPRFTDNLDGTVTDNLTGLIWLKDANCFGTRTWNNALSDCNGLASGTCGLTDGSSAGDWRLPSLFELESLRDMSNYFPCLPSGHPFTTVQSYDYWSSTTYAFYTPYAWYVYMGYGYVYLNDKVSSIYVWPVRGGQ